MNKIFSLTVAALLMLFATTASAESGEATCDKAKCDKSACSKTATTGSCPVSKALAGLPEITFQVGDKELCCETSATVVAEQTDSKVQYLVAKKAYDNKHDAMVALADATEKFVAEFATPHTCSVSGTTTVAGTSTTCDVTAGKLAKITKSAMADVKLAYKVGDETCSCPNKAAALAKSAGQEKHFVINGEETACEIDARIKLARAKYEAAVKALVKAQSAEADPQS